MASLDDNTASTLDASADHTSTERESFGPQNHEASQTTTPLIPPFIFSPGSSTLQPAAAGIEPEDKNLLSPPRTASPSRFSEDLFGAPTVLSPRFSYTPQDQGEALRRAPSPTSLWDEDDRRQGSGSSSEPIQESQRSSRTIQGGYSLRRPPSPTSLRWDEEDERPPARGESLGTGYDIVDHFDFPRDGVSPAFDILNSPPSRGRSRFWRRKEVEKTLYAFLGPTNRGGPKSTARKRLIRGYEPPCWSALIIHTILCALIYPALLICSLLAADKSIYWARFIVAAGSTLIGVAVAASLLRMSRRIMESATWSTIIHQSRIEGNPGVRLKDVAAHCHNPTSIWPAIRLFWDRHAYPGADRRVRKEYDSHPWSMYLLLFVVVVLVSFFLPFIFGRIVLIDTWNMQQSVRYQQVPVAGQMTDLELNSMSSLWRMFEDESLSWTLPSSESPSTVSLSWKNDTVYFPELTRTLLWGNGSSVNTDPASAPGSWLRYPRWGVRTRCTKINNSRGNIHRRSASNVSYVFTGRTLLRGLFAGLSLPLPAQLEKTANFSQMNHGDMLPARLDVLGTSLIAKFPDNGESYSLKSVTIDQDPGWEGFATVETVLIRLNTTYAPQGNFSHWSTDTIPDQDGRPTRIGYDACVCVLVHEPWIVAVVSNKDGLGSVVTTNIQDDGTQIRDVNLSSQTEKVVAGPRFEGDFGTWTPAEKLRPAFIVAQQNAVNRLARGNNRGGSYLPSSKLLSFTDGEGPYGYTSLSPERYAQARAIAAATSTLPYLLGTGTQVARQYSDQQITTSTLDLLFLGLVIAILFILGIVLTFFIPALPEPVPRRGFDFYSWFAAMQTGEIVASSGQRMRRKMDLDDPEVLAGLGDMRIRFIEWEV